MISPSSHSPAGVRSLVIVSVSRFHPRAARTSGVSISGAGLLPPLAGAGHGKDSFDGFPVEATGFPPPLLPFLQGALADFPRSGRFALGEAAPFPLGFDSLGKARLFGLLLHGFDGFFLGVMDMMI